MRNRPIGSNAASPVPSLAMSGPTLPLEPVLDPGAEQHAGGAEADEAEEDPATDGSAGGFGSAAGGGVIDHYSKSTEPSPNWITRPREVAPVRPRQPWSG